MDQSASAPVDGKYYEVATPHSLAERLVIQARDTIFGDFMRICKPGAGTSILDVGVSDVTGDAANVLERRYPYPHNITAAGLGAAPDFCARYKEVNYVQITANAKLPFADRSFDIVTANAVLEHVGSPENQKNFVGELLRVGAEIFVTVPHRFFPVEHHTGIPFLHWGDASFSLACRLLGKAEWGRPENLILMSRRRLAAVCPAGIAMQIGQTGIKLGPVCANLYLHARG